MHNLPAELALLCQDPKAEQDLLAEVLASCQNAAALLCRHTAFCCMYWGRCCLMIQDSNSIPDVLQLPSLCHGQLCSTKWCALGITLQTAILMRRARRSLKGLGLIDRPCVRDLRGLFFLGESHTVKVVHCIP